jgi:hypothetical protein
MRVLKKITFVLGEFAAQTPAQQLLDRFLLGYPRDGAWRRFTGTTMLAIAPPGIGEEELSRRVTDFGLVRTTDLVGALRESDAVLLFPGESRFPTPEILSAWLMLAQRGGPPAFAYGTLGPRPDAMRRELMSVPTADPICGTWASVASRLPQVDVPTGARVAEALVVVQGAKLHAELVGLDLVLSLVERRRGGEAGIERVEKFSGQEVWRRGAGGEWSWPLLAAALSRSNSPQGDALKDARTQDLVGLGLVEKLARDPRGVTLHHKDGLRSTVLVLDGVVADINFAVQLKQGGILSAQVLRGPPPAENHYSKLVASLDDYFRTRTLPWSDLRGTHLSHVLAQL